MIVFGREKARWRYLLVLLFQLTMRASCRLDVVNQRNVLESENENIILLKLSDEGNGSIKPVKERGAPNFEEFKEDEKRLKFDLPPTSFLPTKLKEENPMSQRQRIEQKVIFLLFCRFCSK